MKRFKNILYVCESSVEQSHCIARAISLAQANQAELTVMDVIPDITGISLPANYTAEGLHNKFQAQRFEALRDLVEPFADQVSIKFEVQTGKLFLEAIRSILTNNYDLAIKPGENPSWTDHLFGSNDRQLLRKCPCPLWIMKSTQQQKYSNIVAAVDFGVDFADPQQQALNRSIIQLSSDIAIADSADLHVVHAWDAPIVGMLQMWADQPEEAKRVYIDNELLRHQVNMNKLKKLLPEWIGQEAINYCAPQYHLPMGTPDQAIPKAAQRLKADLVVMGTVARTGISGFIIGNTAEAILDQLQCSVLAVKPSGFETPIKVQT